MNNRGPLLTLSAVVGLAVVLFGVNMAITGNTAGQQPSEYGTTTATPEGTAPATTAAATPTPTATATEAATGAGGFEGTYAGRTAGGEATVAIAAKNGRAVAYLCDGRRLEAWLQGSVSGNQLTLSGRGGSINGTLRGNALFGTIELGGKSWPYSAQPAERPAGLYRADATVRGVQRRIGWIVLQDGRQVGVESAGTTTSAAPTLNAERREATVDGVRVEAESVDGDERFGS